MSGRKPKIARRSQGTRPHSDRAAGVPSRVAPAPGSAAVRVGGFAPRSWFFGLLERIPLVARRRGTRFSRAQALAAVPVRNDLIQWEVREPDDGASSTAVVVLRIPRRQDRWGNMLNRFFEGPSHRQVVLDELGTDVWQLCDGRTSVDALIRALARKHKLQRREVEVSLTKYLRTLAKRGFIGLRAGEE